MTRRLLGVSHEPANFDPTGAQATEAGRRFGLIGWWPSDWSAHPSDVTDTLAIDEQGLASAWRKSYAGDGLRAALRLAMDQRGAGAGAAQGGVDRG